jgi:hypothetical protein
MPAKGTVSHGKSFRIDIDDTGSTARNVSGDCREFSWPLASAVAEAMGAGDSYEEYVAGLKGSKLSGTFMMNDVADTGSWTVLGDSLGATRSVAWYPFGNTGGYPKISADVVVTGVSPSGNLTDVITFKWDAVSTGTVTIGTA